MKNRYHSKAQKERHLGFQKISQRNERQEIVLVANFFALEKYRNVSELDSIGNKYHIELSSNLWRLMKKTTNWSLSRLHNRTNTDVGDNMTQVSLRYSRSPPIRHLEREELFWQVETHRRCPACARYVLLLSFDIQLPKQNWESVIQHRKNMTDTLVWKYVDANFVGNPEHLKSLRNDNGRRGRSDFLKIVKKDYKYRETGGSCLLAEEEGRRSNNKLSNQGTQLGSKEEFHIQIKICNGSSFMWSSRTVDARDALRGVTVCWTEHMIRNPRMVSRILLYLTRRSLLFKLLFQLHRGWQGWFLYCWVFPVHIQKGNGSIRYQPGSTLWETATVRYRGTSSFTARR